MASEGEVMHEITSTGQIVRMYPGEHIPELRFAVEQVLPQLMKLQRETVQNPRRECGIG
jgi:hypothetical protein